MAVLAGELFTKQEDNLAGTDGKGSETTDRLRELNQRRTVAATEYLSFIGIYALALRALLHLVCCFRRACQGYRQTCQFPKLCVRTRSNTRGLTDRLGLP